MNQVARIVAKLGIGYADAERLLAELGKEQRDEDLTEAMKSLRKSLADISSRLEKQQTDLWWSAEQKTRDVTKELSALKIKFLDTERALGQRLFSIERALQLVAEVRKARRKA